MILTRLAAAVGSHRAGRRRAQRHRLQRRNLPSRQPLSSRPPSRPAAEPAPAADPAPQAEPDKEPKADKEPKPDKAPAEEAPAAAQEAREPAPEAAPAEPQLKLFIYSEPKKLELTVGETAKLSAWLCPPGDGHFGTDEEPATADDTCAPAKDAAWSVEPASVASLGKDEGAKVRLTADSPVDDAKVIAELGDLKDNAKLSIKAAPAPEPVVESSPRSPRPRSPRPTRARAPSRMSPLPSSRSPRPTRARVPRKTRSPRPTRPPRGRGPAGHGRGAQARQGAAGPQGGPGPGPQGRGACAPRP